MVVSGEQRARAARGQRFRDRPCEAEAVERAGASADFIENNQAARAGVMQDVRCLGHLDHEGRLAGVDLVGAADAGEDRVEDADARAGGGHE